MAAGPSFYCLCIFSVVFRKAVPGKLKHETLNTQTLPLLSMFMGAAFNRIRSCWFLFAGSVVKCYINELTYLLHGAESF